MELDINPEWPTLITYRTRGILSSVFVPNYQQPPTLISFPTNGTSSPSTGAGRADSVPLK